MFSQPVSGMQPIARITDVLDKLGKFLTGRLQLAHANDMAQLAQMCDKLTPGEVSWSGTSISHAACFALVACALATCITRTLRLSLCRSSLGIQSPSQCQVQSWLRLSLAWSLVYSDGLPKLFHLLG